MKDQANIKKVIATSLTAIIATIIVEIAMYAQMGVALTSGIVMARVGMMVVLAIVIVVLAILDLRFDSYITILAMILCAIGDFGGFSQVADRTSLVGLLVQLVAIIGFLASLAGIWYGIMQRKKYADRKLKERLKWN